MKKIVLFAPDNCMPSTLTGPMDVFTSAGVSWNFINAQAPLPCFEVETVTTHGNKIRCHNGIEFPVKNNWRDIKEADLIFIPSFAILGAGPTLPQDLVDWFQDMAAKGCIIASVCTGTFFLAGTGLLNHKRATTHWAFQDLLKKQYPDIEVVEDHILVDDNNIVTAGGGSAWHDLVLFLIERFSGLEAANHVAKMFLLDRHENPQSSYATSLPPSHHNDKAILDAQKWMAEHFKSTGAINQAIQHSGLAERTFYRRFKHALGFTPTRYLQLIRIEKSKVLLEDTSNAIEDIAFQIGYENVGSFRRLFKQEVKLVPAEYRKKFRSGIQDASL
ncbi:MAG: helix-turn-helix domain-containing protein [Gammaproteobacteria bacterium]|nr:helix-turn-helix domain-containing protein [Gammaproteobacteria bacterium]